MAKYDEHLLEDQHVERAPDSPIGSPTICSIGGKVQECEAEEACGDNAVLLQVKHHGSASTFEMQQARRRAASELIQAATGVFLPFSTDQALRSGLKDGTLLCKMANTVLNAGIEFYEAADVMDMGPQGLLRQRNHNISCFLAAVEQQLYPLPADCRFTVADLEAEGCDTERPQVTNCLLYIKAACQQQMAAGPLAGTNEQLPTTPLAPHSAGSVCSRHQPQHSRHVGSPASSQVQQRLSFGSPGMASMSYASQPAQQQQQRSFAPPAMSSSPLMDGHGSLSHGGHASFHANSIVPAHNAARDRSSGSHAGSSHAVQTAAGVTKLMQQCTSMLKDRMFPAEPGSGGGSRYSSPAGQDLKALWPVLEGVLGQLTGEYEKRLLTKDHDLSRVCDVKAKLEKEVDRLQAEIQKMRQESESRSAAIARVAAEESAADSSALQQQLAELQGMLQQREHQLGKAEAELAASNKSKADAIMQLQVELRMVHKQLDALQDVEDRYKWVLQENRTLYNTVQDLRGNIRVFCRIRPPGATGDLSPSCVDVGMEGDLALYDLANGTKRVFKVDRVFDPSTDQAAVYEDTQPLIRSVLDGYNVCIFAYGQTGSGKTHTMSGTFSHDTDGRGINYRALDDLFSIRDTRKQEASYSFRVQMLEIYNEVLRDLLVDPRAIGPNKLDILATQASGCNVPGATQVEVQSAEDVSRLMAQGASQRATSETRMNDRSSRSHQILTVIVEGVHHVTRARSHACLHLIDLAGSERVSKSEASGDRLVEAQHINKSLSALGDVMAALAGKDRHVPYRNSKLTQLLQDSLQGQAKVMMFMHVSPEADMFGESISTLKFASRVSEITLGLAKKNVVSGKVFEAHEEMLKQQRSMEGKEQQLQHLQGVLQQEQAEKTALQQEVAQLRQQLQSSAAEASAAAAAAATSSSQHRGQFHLPIQQMLAAQAATGSPRSAREGAVATAAVSARGHQPLSAGAAAAPLLDQSPGAGQGTGTNSGIKLSRPQDRTPPRDQDDISQASARLRPAPEASPLGQHCTSGYDCTSLEATPRATPRTARGSLPMRESISSLRHLERLQSARQAGSFRAAGAASTVGSGGGVSVKAFVDAVSMGGAAGASKLGSNGGRQSFSGAQQGPLAASRSRLDASMPLTSRVSGVAKSRVSEVPSSMSMRQSGIYRTSSTGSSAGGVRAGAAGVSGAATSRAGSRWK